MDYKSIAKIAKGTKRKKREINLLELSEEIKNLYGEYNSLEKVAKIIKLSSEMVREFLKINELDSKVKEFIKSGKINSIDICYRISKLIEKDQYILAKKVIEKNFSSYDVRAIVKYKKDNPKVTIEKVIDKVIKSKNIKLYVAYLGIEDDTFQKLVNKVGKKQCLFIIKSLFKDFILSEFLYFFDLNGRVLIIKVTKEGFKMLRNKSKSLRVPIEKLGDALVSEYLKRNNE